MRRKGQISQKETSLLNQLTSQKGQISQKETSPMGRRRKNGGNEKDSYWTCSGNSMWFICISGGGLILVPAFIYILKMEDKLSRGTATVCILPMVIVSSIFYYKGNYINWKIGVLCAAGGVAGGIVGTKLLKKIPAKYTRVLFTVFLLYVSIKLLF